MSDDRIDAFELLEPVMAIGQWRNNAELIADCARLGYLPAVDDHAAVVCDPTYGLGRFWKIYRPSTLVASDLEVAKSPVGYPVDFTSLPWASGRFDASVFDPPYKLNGTSTGVGAASCDPDYGVDTYRSQAARHGRIRAGIAECVRVTQVGGYVLVKCQDQVNGGKVRWQTREFAAHAESLGCRLVDALHLPSYRPQPEGRTQQHARRNYSTMLVLRRERLVRRAVPAA
jgi:hypothetical protein